MNNFKNFLKILKENNLNKTYDKIMADIIDIKSALSIVNEEVNDAILGLLSDGKYEEVNKLTSIPGMSVNIINELEELLKSYTFNEKIEKGVDLSIYENVETLEYSGVITSIKGLKKGAKLVHKSFGIGTVVSLEDNPNCENKILIVNFDSCGEKPFNCSSEILSKYFNIMENEEREVSKCENRFDVSEDLKELLEKVEKIIFKINPKIEKSKTNTYYKYILNNKVICSINCNPKRINLFFNIPIGNMIDTENLLIDVSTKGHIGIGDYKLSITKDMDIDGLYVKYITEFLEQTIKYFDGV